MPSTGVVVCDFCFLEVYFWQTLLGDDDEDEAFVFVQIWERTGEQEFKRFFFA